MREEELIRLKELTKDLNPNINEDTVVPEPERDDEISFIKRCMKELSEEYGELNSAAICIRKWSE